MTALSGCVCCSVKLLYRDVLQYDNVNLVSVSISCKMPGC